jgi:hypothetical protein
VALVDQLLDEVWAGPWAVVLNPTWFEGVPQQYAALVDSWEAAYSLTITATQVWGTWGGGGQERGRGFMQLLDSHDLQLAVGGVGCSTKANIKVT